MKNITITEAEATELLILVRYFKCFNYCTYWGNRN